MKVLSLVHHEVAGSGVFADEISLRGHELEEWMPAAGPLPRPLRDYGAVIAFGGGMQTDEVDRYPWLRVATDALAETLTLGVPTLGVCLGAQVLARAAGGQVGPASQAEWGWNAVELTDPAAEDPLFSALPRTIDVFQWHSYAFELPPRAVALARSPVCLQSYRIGSAAWGVQWHPEVTAESVLLWAAEHPPSQGGVPVSVGLAELQAAVKSRIAPTNDEGRRLCGRFLAAAEQVRVVPD
jgi:GMP synthase-like glutamine amidotransferase